jgi:hypothetical protein
LKKLIITLVFKKNTNFFAENWEKSQKIMIITSIPGDLVPDPGVKQKHLAHPTALVKLPWLRGPVSACGVRGREIESRLGEGC